MFLCLFAHGQEPSDPPSDLKIKKVRIVPERVSLFPGQQVKFRFMALSETEEEIPAAFSWTFSGGTLEQNGTYTAGSEPGEYSLEAAVSTGIKAEAQITVVDPEAAEKKVHKIVVHPPFVTLKPGESCRFKFTAYNHAGKPLSAPFSISYAGGTLDNQGNFTAGERPGQYKICVSTPEGRQAFADVLIATGQKGLILSDDPCKVLVIPTRITLVPGQRCKFSFTVYNATGQEVTDDLSLSIQGGQFLPDGTYIAGQTPGEYTLEARTTNGISGKASIEIRDGSARPPVSSPPDEKTEGKERTPALLYIFPSEVALKAGETCSFRFFALDRQGVEVKCPISIRFSGGVFGKDGTFVAGEVPGEYEATVSSPPYNLKAVAKIRIEGPSLAPEKPGKLARLEIIPGRIRLRPGQVHRFHYKATDAKGRSTNTQLGWTYYGGRLDGEGNFTAGSMPGQYYLTLTSSEGIEAMAVIAVLGPSEEAAKPWWLLVTPHKVTLRPRETCRFSYRVVDDEGNEMPGVKLEWESRGGTFDSKTMTFTAGDERGDFYLKAEHSENLRTRVHIVIK